MMKSSAKQSSRTRSTAPKQSTPRTRSTCTSQSAGSRLGRSVKKVAKQTLRDMLLSKTFHTSFKVLAWVSLSVGVVYGGFIAVDHTFANQVVVSKSEIVRSAAKHIMLPEGEPVTVVRVQDAETLKKQQGFYTNVKIGDYVIVYPDIVVIYDLRNDKIVATKAL